MSATPAPQPAPTQAQLDAVLQAALYLLGARQDRMLTIEEWTDLARAGAACQERKTAEYLTDHDLEDMWPADENDRSRDQDEVNGLFDQILTVASECA